ncbi:MAG: dephospho-CoA kinase [Bacteroidales bacterium]
MIKVGITGGIGSGKSLLCTYLLHRGIEVYNCDIQAKRIMNHDPEVKGDIINLLGEDSYLSDGLNRKYIANKVFNDRLLLNSLNSIVHPAVRRDFLNWSNSLDVEIVALEAAILFEGSFHTAIDKIITVEASTESRISRVIARDSLSRDEVERRIANQMSSQERIDRADFVIYNEDDQAIIPQIEFVLSSIGIE